MKNLLGNGNEKIQPAIAVVVVVLALVAVFFGSRDVQTSTNALATPSATAAACAPGAQKDFECVGSISGTQTYYECNNGAWESKSRYNYSECAKTTNSTAAQEEPSAVPPAGAANTATAIPSVSPATPAANASIPGFVNMTVQNIRATSAELYWFTNANATGTMHYGTEPGVRRWILARQFAAFSQYQQLRYISPNTTYYFEVEMCANNTCVKTPMLNFTTPLTDTYFVGDTTVPYPGDQVNFTAAQLNSG